MVKELVGNRAISGGGKFSQYYPHGLPQNESANGRQYEKPYQPVQSENCCARIGDAVWIREVSDSRTRDQPRLPLQAPAGRSAAAGTGKGRAPVTKPSRLRTLNQPACHWSSVDSSPRPETPICARRPDLVHQRSHAPSGSLLIRDVEVQAAACRE